MHLLVVDDDAAVREALALVLGLDGFEVTPAADGREGIRTLSTGRPDAIILDVLMPGIDGLEVCRRIRATGDRTPVLMLTARAEVTERVAGLEAGTARLCLDSGLERGRAGARRGRWGRDRAGARRDRRPVPRRLRRPARARRGPAEYVIAGGARERLRSGRTYVPRPVLRRASPCAADGTGGCASGLTRSLRPLCCWGPSCC